MFDRHVREQAQRRPGAPAILTAERVVSFAELDADVDRAATLCRSLDPAPGEAVAVAVGEPTLECVAMLALARLGIAWAPGDDPLWRLRISDRDHEGAAVRLSAWDLQGVPHATAPDRAPADPSALGRVAVTSGTTGRRKRLALSWGAIEARCQNAVRHYGLAQGPWLSGTGVHTTFGFNIVVAAWMRGQAVILGPSGALDLPIVRRFRPHLISCIPTQLAALLDVFGPDRPPTPFRVVVGAGTVPPPLARRVRAALTEDLLCVYGAAETGGVALAGLDDLESRPNVAGRALPASRIEIVDERDAAALPDTLGHVRIASDRLATGTIDDEGTEVPILRDGWFYPGDLGRIDAAGRLFVEGRSDDVMNIAGHKVMPSWVEQAALTCAGLRDAAAFGLKDADGLDRCCMAVVCEATLDIEALRAALREPLRWLTAVEIVQVVEIPRNALGKIDRVRLRETGLAARPRAT